MNDAERKNELIARFSHCRAASSLHPLSKFIWRRAFTFNIDDMLEDLYARTRTAAKQRLVSINYDEPLEPTPNRDELQLIHLHGWVHAPSSPFVFSHADYARVMTSMNPWMHVLSEILATESFIIAGTSLNEVDLEYYLSRRTQSTPRKDRGPSLLIEPFPDAATEADCIRYGLTLVKATFAEFLGWLAREFPMPPSLADLIVPSVGNLFPNRSTTPQLLRFFSDFRLITPVDRPRGPLPSAFYYGRPPSPEDLDQHLDIPRTDNELLLPEVQQLLGSKTASRCMIIFDDAGVGKSTVLARLGHDLARLGHPVLALHTVGRLDSQCAIKCIGSASSQVVVLVDGIADHAEQILEILEDPQASSKLVVVASERAYRREYVDLVFGDMPRLTRGLQELTGSERKQLVEALRKFGLVGSADALKHPDAYAVKLKGDPIAIAVCRILNDFRPLESIVSSLWAATEERLRVPYLCVALATYCQVSGIRYSLLQASAGPTIGVTDLFTNAVPLRVTDNPEDSDYVIPINAVIGERVLARAAVKEKELVRSTFLALARVLAPHVNRVAIMRRTAEARLAARLFDADKVVRPYLGAEAESWYVEVQSEWEWNSRYWEQRALLVADSDIETAVRYAKHAVAIEVHPFTLTTLGKVLFKYSEQSAEHRETAFQEAFDRLGEAIRREGDRSRITVHPFATLLAGVANYLVSGGKLSDGRRSTVLQHVTEARRRFYDDAMIQGLVNRIESIL